MAEAAPLSILGNLSLLAADGSCVAVSGAESVITVTLPRLPSRLRVVGPLASREHRVALLAGLHRCLRHADLTLEFRVRQQLVARLRPESRPGMWSRLLGLDAVEVLPIPCLRAFLFR